jgi:myosin heavy subunit
MQKVLSLFSFLLQAALLEGFVWAASDDCGWVKGKVASSPPADCGPNSVVEISLVPRKHSSDAAGRRISVALGDLLPVSELDDDTGSIGDVLQLQVLHDAAVFETLRLRYFDDKIYTQAGPTSLISINPYKQITALYTQRTINLYASNTENSSPHVFGMSQNAYNNLVEYGVCQSILCSGESGAGKTEVRRCARLQLCARYFYYVYCRWPNWLCSIWRPRPQRRPV